MATELDLVNRTISTYVGTYIDFGGPPVLLVLTEKRGWKQRGDSDPQKAIPRHLEPHLQTDHVRQTQQYLPLRGHPDAVAESISGPSLSRSSGSKTKGKMMTFEEAINAGKVSTEQACEIFDALAPVLPEDITGTWKGSEFPSGHPMDGSLADSGWFGKRFIDADTVDPLLFYSADRTSFFAADPIRKGQASARGVTDIASVRGEVETDSPTARLRQISYRGVVTTAMVYDHLAIIDYFRKVNDSTLLGAMDRRGDPGIYFFVLRRES